MSLAVAVATCCACSSPTVRAPTTDSSTDLSNLVEPASAERDTEGADDTRQVVRRTMAIAGMQRCLIDDGKLYCWNEEGNAPPGPVVRSVPPCAIPHPVTSVASSGDTVCATTDQGTVWCWGTNDQGQLGAGLTARASETPVAVRGLDDALAVAMSWSNVCVVRRAGKVSCWGSNEQGQAGHATGYRTEVRRLVRPIEVEGVRAVVDIAMDPGHTCAVSSTGETHCWGEFSIHDMRVERLPDQYWWWVANRPVPCTMMARCGAGKTSIQETSFCPMRRATRKTTAPDP